VASFLQTRDVCTRHTDPRSSRQGLRTFANPLLNLSNRQQLDMWLIEFASRDANRMTMCRNDPGNDCCAAKLNDLRSGRLKAADFLIRTGVHDSATSDRHRGDDPILRIHRENLSTEQYHLGTLLSVYNLCVI
jgi:hypothetical protein